MAAAPESLFSMFTDLFFKKPKPKSTPSERQDELVKNFPGSKIIRRPNPMEEADDSPYIKFPNHDCVYYMTRLYEAVRIYGKDDWYERIVRQNCGIEIHPADELKNE